MKVKVSLQSKEVYMGLSWFFLEQIMLSIDDLSLLTDGLQVVSFE